MTNVIPAVTGLHADTQVYAFGLCCGAPASETWGHHHPHKGMGGQGPKVAEHPTYPICERHHLDYIHAGLWIMDTEEADFVRFYDAEGTLLRRVPKPDCWRESLTSDELALPVWELRPVLSYLTDATLYTLWGQVEAQEYHLAAFEAALANVAEERLGPFGNAWYEEARRLMQDHVGRRVSIGTVYNRAHLWQFVRFWEGRYAEMVEQVGLTLAAHIGTTADPQIATEEALKLLDSGMTKTAVRRMLKAPATFQSVETEPRSGCAHVWVCRLCGRDQ